MAEIYGHQRVRRGLSAATAELPDGFAAAGRLSPDHAVLPESSIAAGRTDRKSGPAGMAYPAGRIRQLREVGRASSKRADDAVFRVEQCAGDAERTAAALAGIASRRQPGRRASDLSPGHA